MINVLYTSSQEAKEHPRLSQFFTFTSVMVSIFLCLLIYYRFYCSPIANLTLLTIAVANNDSLAGYKSLLYSLMLHAVFNFFTPIQFLLLINSITHLLYCQLIPVTTNLPGDGSISTTHPPSTFYY